ncbi:hypothetical protein K2173_020147 [Erythroxylum novogranatense]|uniref:Uncharacterized protein n=1 Tax=Erythroxylum novogranatense TaxID=1862640 RepID=A0AAV8UBH8_9ROSI|nr:hypothetical protein K2173_020147 [Erythroxylum novogranatense]
MIPTLDDVYSYSPFQLLLDNFGVMDADTWILFSQRKTGINIAQEGYYQDRITRRILLRGSAEDELYKLPGFMTT